MSNFVLKCFGVGDGWACADRDHASFLYRLGGVSILIDCGESVSGSFKAAGLACDSLDHIFISHLHSDHLAGFFMLMQGFWLEQRKKALPVHLPADGIKPVSRLLEASMLFPELLRFRLKFHALRAGKSVLTRGVRVTPFRSSHLDSLRRAFQKKHPQRFESFGFLIEAGQRRIGHSADIGRPEDLEPLLRRPLDLLVCELAHFPPEDLFRYLRNRDVKRVIFVHLAREHWKNVNRTRRLAAKLLPGIPCAFARDHEEFSL
jgi:ribonuclease BN (tRNA processing enzyme)